ncbi:MAG: hypothetical protein QMD71_01380 [bacterium]|nr:hypothetical protein [bacterium]
MKFNASTLYQSIPYKDKFYGPNNMPDIKTIQISCGILETSQILKATYTKHSGKIEVHWDPIIRQNGKPDDNAFIVTIYWKIKESKEWYPDLKPWRTLKLWGDAINPVAKRRDGQASVYLNNPPSSVYLNDSTNFIIYLFFHNPKTGYSPSVACKTDII